VKKLKETKLVSIVFKVNSEQKKVNGMIEDTTSFLKKKYNAYGFGYHVKSLTDKRF